MWPIHLIGRLGVLCGVSGVFRGRMVFGWVGQMLRPKIVLGHNFVAGSSSTGDAHSTKWLV